MIQMEGIKKELSLTEAWASPAVFPCYSGSQGQMVNSTPNLSAWTCLEDNEGSRQDKMVNCTPNLSARLEEHEGSRQDSGYSSFTPSSSGSFGQISGKSCRHCNKLANYNYEQSTPEGMLCNCEKKSFFDSQSPSHTEYLQQMSKSSLTIIKSRFRQSRALDLYDTSLYTEDMDVYESGEHQCDVGPMEIGDEKSIDFLDSGIFMSSSKPDNSGRFKKSEEKTDKEVKSSEVGIRNTCSPEKDVFHFKAVSPKAQNETTPTKRKSSNSFQTVGKKVTLMKRVLRTINGIDKVDILYQLVDNHISCPHVVSQIFSYLPENDLDSVRLVSKTWQKILGQDEVASKRWSSYNTAMILKKENLMSPTKPGTSGGKLRSQPFSPLHNINNQYSSPPPATNFRISPPVSPDSARFRSFQRAAKSLKNGERLLPCPKCYFPSHDQGNPTVQCSRSGCRHRFCVWCRNEIVSGRNHNCPPLYTPPPLNIRRSTYKLPAVGSKSCKRNLRRL